MTSKNILFFILISFAFVVESNAQVVLRPIQEQVREFVFDKTPVSGEIYVGILADYDDTPMAPTSFFTRLPKYNYEGKKLCTTISSRDGRYRVTFPIDLSNEKVDDDGLILEWKSKYSDKLTSYNKKDLAILSKVAGSCEADPDFYVVTSWGKKDLETFTILLNSLKPPRVLIVNNNKAEPPCKCERIDEVHVAYNYKCEIKVKANNCNENTAFFIQNKVERLGTTTIKRTEFPIKLCLD